MTANSALYVGHVMHNRLTPQRHVLRHRAYWMLIDLAEADELSERLKTFSYNQRNLMSIWDRDHGDGSHKPLLGQTQDLLADADVDPAGLSIRLLCMPRVFGFDFNPLSVFFCVDPEDRLVAMIYEVNNTFGGRHRYVIPAEKIATGPLQQQCAKEFYVSPFMDMDMTYRFRTRTPDAQITLGVQVGRDGETVISTGLEGTRRALSDAGLLRVSVSHPMLPQKVMGAIHWHALRMWFGGFKVNPEKPSKRISQTIVRPNP